jgi:hypothetical protein
MATDLHSSTARQRFVDLPAPTAATMFTASQTYGLLAGWLVYLLGTFTLSFSLAWPPLRSYLFATTGPTLLVTLSLWAGAFLFTFIAGRMPFSPIRLKEGYIPGTKVLCTESESEQVKWPGRARASRSTRTRWHAGRDADTDTDTPAGREKASERETPSQREKETPLSE